MGNIIEPDDRDEVYGLYEKIKDKEISYFVLNNVEEYCSTDHRVRDSLIPMMEKWRNDRGLEQIALLHRTRLIRKFAYKVIDEKKFLVFILSI